MNTTDNHFQKSHREEDSGFLLLVLAAWWREIVLGVVLLAVAGGAAILALMVVSPKYEASADVAIVQTEANVSIDERFKAVTEQRNMRDMRARRSALVGLVENGKIAIAVAQQIEWPEEDLKDRALVAKLLGSVSGSLVTIGVTTKSNHSDLIRITCEARSPEMAVAIANAWAEEYTAQVNQLYERVPQSVLSTVRSELQNASGTYEKAQTALEEFAADHEVVRLDSQIAINNESVSNLHRVRQNAFSALFNKALESRIEFLTQLHDKKTRLSKLLDAAIDLRAHIEIAGDAGLRSNGTAIQLLKFQIYTLNDAMPDNLELRFEHASRAHTDTSAQKADVDAIVSSLKYRIEKVDRDMDELNRTLIDRLSDRSDLPMKYMGIGQPETEGADSALTGAGNYIEQLIFEISSQTQLLNARKERLLARRQSLEQERDLARSTIETLRNEVVELQLTAAAAPSVVRIASVAVRPRDSSWPSPVFVAIGAGTVGFPIVTFLAFFLNFLGVRPFLRKQEVER